MTSIFADTAFWIAMLSPKDSNHLIARRLAEQYKASGVLVVTTENVLTELLAMFSGTGVYGRRRAVELVHYLQSAPHIRVIEQSHASFMAGLDLYQRRLDKGYSLVDCTSMAAMRAEQITEVLTADRHFEQEGFKLLY